MKRFYQLALWALPLGVLLSSCLEISIDNPLLPGSASYLGDQLAVDSDRNGTADIVEICAGDLDCIQRVADEIRALCGEDAECQLRLLMERFEEDQTDLRHSSSLETSSSLLSSEEMFSSHEGLSSSVNLSTERLSSEESGWSSSEWREESSSSLAELSSSFFLSSSSETGVVGCPVWSRKSYSMPVIGFSPSWASYSIPWGKITQLNYAFGLPTATGGMDAPLSTLKNLAITGHQQGVEVWLSIGGAGYGDVFPAMAANANYRASFVQQVLTFAQQSCIDGIDIDWESWSGSASGTVNSQESASLTTLLRELRAALSPFNIKLSADVYPSDWNGRHYEAAIITSLDQLNVMAYDFTGSWSAEGNHSSYGDSRNALNYWASKLSAVPGYSPSKLMLGVPFYGKDFAAGAASITFKEILARYPGAAEDADSQYGKIYYNAKPLLRQKVALVQNGGWGGIMIWELSQDDGSSDANSLLDAIHRSAGN